MTGEMRNENEVAINLPRKWVWAALAVLLAGGVGGGVGGYIPQSTSDVAVEQAEMKGTDAAILARFDGLEALMNARFDGLEARIERVENQQQGRTP